MVRCREKADGSLTTLLLVTHVATVIVAVTLPDAADAAAVGAAVLVGQAAVFCEEEEDRMEPARQTCSSRKDDGFGLTSLHACEVEKLVSGGTLALQLPVGRGRGRSPVGANTRVSMARLRQTQQAARLVNAGIVACWKTSACSTVNTVEPSNRLWYWILHNLGFPF